MKNQNTRPPLDFTPEVAIKATGANGRLYTITAKRSSSDAGTTTAYSVSVFSGIYTTELEPSSASTRTLVDAMEKCVEHETAARKALAPTGLVFKPFIYFHAAGSGGRRYSIDYEAGTFVEGTSYEYPAWVEVDRDSTPIGTWAALKDAIAGCNETELAQLAETSKTDAVQADES